MLNQDALTMGMVLFDLIYEQGEASAEYSGDFFCMPQDEQSTNLFPIKFRKRCKIVIIISHAIFSQQYNAKPHMEFYSAHLHPEYI